MIVCKNISPKRLNRGSLLVAILSYILCKIKKMIDDLDDPMI